MIRKYRRYDKNGVEIEDDDEFLRDGERLVTTMMFTDAARNRDIRAACDERNAMRNLPAEEQRRIAEKAEYEKRFSNAWRGGPSQADHDCYDDDFDDSPEAERARYIKRITNAGALARDYFHPHPAG
jgi:hypothetical protein